MTLMIPVKIAKQMMRLYYCFVTYHPSFLAPNILHIVNIGSEICVIRRMSNFLSVLL